MIRNSERKFKMSNNEKWLTVPVLNYANYEVSNLGRIRNKARGNTLKGFYDKDGYKIVCLSSGDNQKTFRVHRLVAEAFIPNPENKPQINHKNEVRDDNKVDNLEWSTSKENNNYGNRIAKASSKTRNGVLSMRVLQMDMNDNLIKEWASISEAGRNGFHKSTISDCCKGKYKQYRGYKWKFKEEQK